MGFNVTAGGVDETMRAVMITLTLFRFKKRSSFFSPLYGLFIESKVIKSFVCFFF